MMLHINHVLQSGLLDDPAFFSPPQVFQVSPVFVEILLKYLFFKIHNWTNHKLSLFFSRCNFPLLIKTQTSTL